MIMGIGEEWKESGDGMVFVHLIQDVASDL